MGGKFREEPTYPNKKKVRQEVDQFIPNGLNVVKARGTYAYM
jgi:hypothetical protein